VERVAQIGGGVDVGGVLDRDRERDVERVQSECAVWQPLRGWERVGAAIQSCGPAKRRPHRLGTDSETCRKRIANRIKELQPKASNRKIAKTLGVGKDTVRRDTGANAPLGRRKASKNKEGSGANAPPVSGAKAVGAQNETSSSWQKLLCRCLPLNRSPLRLGPRQSWLGTARWPCRSRSACSRLMSQVRRMGLSKYLADGLATRACPGAPSLP
jgi:hypothetical protein